MTPCFLKYVDVDVIKDTNLFIKLLYIIMLDVGEDIVFK